MPRRRLRLTGITIAIIARTRITSIIDRLEGTGAKAPEFWRCVCGTAKAVPCHKAFRLSCGEPVTEQSANFVVLFGP